MVPALALLVLAGCAPPTCVIESTSTGGRVEVFDSPFTCTQVQDGLEAAVRLLRVPMPGLVLPSGSITFVDSVMIAPEKLGEAGCYPFSMTLGSGALRTPDSAMAHEVAHWGVGMELKDADCGYYDGALGHADWRERGIYEALHDWTHGR